jgi:hypothetical protein
MSTNHPNASERNKTSRLASLVTLVVGGLLLLGLGFYLGQQRLTGVPAGEAMAATPALATPVPALLLASTDSGAGSPPDPALATSPATAPSIKPLPVTNLDVSTKTAIFDLPVAGDSVYQAKFEGELVNSGWLPFAGDWRFENGGLVQLDTAEVDRGISFRNQVFEEYLLRVSLQHLENSGAGVVFNMPQAGSNRGAHLVRYSSDEPVLFWGYFDQNGGFQGQGHAFVPVPGREMHRLEIISGQETYAIRLDGQLIASNIPLASRAGHIGLSTSQSAAAFNSIEIFELAKSGGQSTAEPGQQLLREARILNGDWRTVGATIQQTDETLTDFLIVTNVTARHYELQVNVELPQSAVDSAVGGGIVFHLPDSEQGGVEGGHLVRFAEGGKELFWGYFDRNGQFVGQGDKALEPSIEHSKNLTLMVEDTTYSILIGDNAIASDIPLQYDGGSVGLLSFGGPVTFSNFSLALDSR